MRQRRGFTLVELMIALLIIAVLTAILLPTLSAVRARAHRNACANNLRQLWTAISLYATDNDTYLPPFPPIPEKADCGDPPRFVQFPRELLASLHPYTRTDALWMCPADRQLPSDATADETEPGRLLHLTSYRYRGYHWTCQGIQPIRIDHTTRVIIQNPGQYNLLSDTGSCPEKGGTEYEIYNHGGRWNRVFLDGHVRSFGLNCTPGPHQYEETP